MNRNIVGSFVAMAMVIAMGSPVVTLAAQSKPALKRKTQSAKPRVTAKQPASASRPAVEQPETDATAPPDIPAPAEGASINVEIIGPVFLTYTLPQNQYFRLKMDQSISSETSRANDRFRTVVVTPVYASGVEVVPAGSIVEGVVTSVIPARSRGREGQIAIAFDTLILPDGTRRTIEGVLTELQNEKAGEVGGENEVSGRSNEKDKIIYIGGGSAGGAILGGAIGGAKGAAIGAIIGAGAGVAGAMIKKGNEAELLSGAEIGMFTTREIVFSIRSERLDR